MRLMLLIASAGVLLAQQPILYQRGAVNAASLAPPGLPNAAIARGGTFSLFGEKLGPAVSPTLAFPLETTLGEVSLSVTQGTQTTAVIPTFVSPSQINAILPSTVTAGLATLRLTFQSRRSNAITIQVADSAPGIFAVSSGGFGPGAVQNFVTSASQPVNSLTVPATRGQAITIWGTGLGPVTFPDNVAPTAGDLQTPVTVSIGGKRATKLYSGRSPCCSGIDQVVVNVPDDAPFGCWVPVVVNAGGVVSNTVTIAIASAGSASCDDAGSPLSSLARTAGTQAFINLEQVDTVQNVSTATPTTKTLQQFYSRFYTRPATPFSFDPYMSYPPAGSCLVHQSSGNAAQKLTFRGVLPLSASFSPQPKQTYNTGSESKVLPTDQPVTASTLGGTVNSVAGGLGALKSNASLVIDPGGANQVTLPIATEPAPGWTRPNGIFVIPRTAPLNLAFTPGDPAAPTAIVIYAYSAGVNATVEVQCLAAPGATSFSVPAETLANLAPSSRSLDGSFAILSVGTLGVNKAVPFSNGLVSNGLLLNSTWLSQAAVIQ